MNLIIELFYNTGDLEKNKKVFPLYHDLMRVGIFPDCYYDTSGNFNVENLIYPIPEILAAFNMESGSMNRTF